MTQLDEDEDGEKDDGDNDIGCCQGNDGAVPNSSSHCPPGLPHIPQLCHLLCYQVRAGRVGVRGHRHRNHHHHHHHHDHHHAGHDPVD